MKEKTISVKVTLRPSQVEIVKSIASNDYDGNFSIALRNIINKHNLLENKIKDAESENQMLKGIIKEREDIVNAVANIHVK